jgi:hypothetical protein
VEEEEEEKREKKSSSIDRDCDLLHNRPVLPSGKKPHDKKKPHLS